MELIDQVLLTYFHAKSSPKSTSHRVQKILLAQKRINMFRQRYQLFNQLQIMALFYLCFVLSIGQQNRISCKTIDSTVMNGNGSSSSQDRELISSISSQIDELDKFINTNLAEPRQYFKINTTSATIGNNKRKRLPKGSNLLTAKRNSISTSTSDVATGEQLEEKSLANTKQTKISNATLKKILNQSLIKAANGTSSSKGSNFKFVFIQRATAAPDRKTLTPSSSSTTTTSPSKPSTSPQPPSSSLAASVSKQLATTLLNSAVNYVGNITKSSAPSLTSLASQIVVQSIENSLKPSPSSSSNSINNSIQDSLTSDESQEDIKRIQKVQPEKKNKTTTTHHHHHHHSSSSSSSMKKNGTKSRPSKIYNLPVKFVSNGQPNGVVFTKIRQHFATIKRLQMATSKLNHQGSSSSIKTNQFGQTKRRKPTTNGQKSKGGNSRLIYLPLMYLSNARPNKILISKATHKSLTNKN